MPSHQDQIWIKMWKENSPELRVKAIEWRKQNAIVRVKSQAGSKGHEDWDTRQNRASSWSECELVKETCTGKDLLPVEGQNISEFLG
jgi:hypothetical protein